MHGTIEKHRLLFIDDEAWSRELLVRQLGDDRFEVTTAANGEEGVQLARGQPFDVVLSDMMMPEMDGLEVVTRLRADGFGGAVIVMTSRSDTSNVVAALEAGADDYVSKPIDPAILAARIEAQVRARVSSTPAPTEAFTVGAVIASKYYLRGFVGAGSFGTVFVADHLRLDTEVALKVLNEEFIRDVDHVADFMRESALTIRVRHPNVVRVLDADVSPGGRPYYVSDLVDGVNLRRLMDGGPLPPDMVTSLVEALGGATSAMHRVGVMHRDLKPGNVFATGRNGDTEFRVGDFGLAVHESDARLIKVTAFHGTVAYMAPERLRGERYGPASDVFSVGVIIYEAMTGRLPFEDAAVDLRAPGSPFMVPAQLDLDAPAPAVRLLSEVMSEDPARRPAPEALGPRWRAAMQGS